MASLGGHGRLLQRCPDQGLLPTTALATIDGHPRLLHLAAVEGAIQSREVVRPDGVARAAPSDRHCIFDIPDHCLSLFCRRLKLNFPSPEALLGGGRVVVQAMLKGNFVAIDFSERAHARLRVDLRSTGRSKNFTVSNNRMLCQNTRAAMKNTLDKAPAKDISLVALPSFGASPGGGNAVVGRSSGDGGSTDQAQRKKGGNPYFQFLNHKRQSFKAHRAPDRPLTQQELGTIQRQSRLEWEAMDGEAREPWRHMFAASLMSVPGGAPALLPEPAAEIAHNGLWGTGRGSQSACPFSESMLCQYKAQSNFQQREQDAFADPSLKVTSLDMQPGDNPDTQRDLFGCFACKKNVCRESLDGLMHDRVVKLTMLLNRFIDSMGVAVAQSGELLVRLHLPAASSGDNRPRDAVGLVTDARFKPKMQFIAKCSLMGESASIICNFPAAFPVDIQIDSSTCRLSPLHAALDIVTSDEWALELSTFGAGWEIQRLQWADIVDDTLLHLKVLGSGPKFQDTAKPPPIRRQGWSAMPADVFEGDPIELGRAAGGSTSLAPEAQADRLDDDGPQGGHQQRGASGDLLPDPEAAEDMVADDLFDRYQGPAY